jgi:hypothetical protein
MKRLMILIAMLAVLGVSCSLIGPQYSVHCPDLNKDGDSLMVVGEKETPVVNDTGSMLTGMTLFPPSLSMVVHAIWTYPNGHVYHVDGNVFGIGDLSGNMTLQMDVTVTGKTLSKPTTCSYKESATAVP